jgi:hypothetical protein
MTAECLAVHESPESEGPWTGVSRYLLGFSALYPSIAEWCAKIRPEIASGRRSLLAFVSSGGDIGGLAITKNGEYSKLCHISISKHARAGRLGSSLMHAAATEMLSVGARRIHVTTSEEVAIDYGDFFERFGFRFHSCRKGRYRTNVDELEWVVSREMLSSRISSAEKFLHRGALEPSAYALVRLQMSHRIGDCGWGPVAATNGTATSGRGLSMSTISTRSGPPTGNE